MPCLRVLLVHAVEVAREQVLAADLAHAGKVVDLLQKKGGNERRLEWKRNTFVEELEQ